MKAPGNMSPVAKDGEMILYSDAEHQVGVLMNERTGRKSDKQPLQVFFKWGNFEPLGEADLERLHPAEEGG